LSANAPAAYIFLVVIRISKEIWTSLPKSLGKSNRQQEILCTTLSQLDHQRLNTRVTEIRKQKTAKQLPCRLKTLKKISVFFFSKAAFPFLEHQ